MAIFFLPHRQARGVTCLREAASAKAGGRFSEQYVYSILDSPVAQFRFVITESTHYYLENSKFIRYCFRVSID